jgi:hypothetical protein
MAASNVAAFCYVIMVALQPLAACGRMTGCTTLWQWVPAAMAHTALQQQQQVRYAAQLEKFSNTRHTSTFMCGVLIMSTGSASPSEKRWHC